MKKEKYLLGLDLGTTNIKGILATFDGKIIAEEKMPMSYITEEIGWVEFDADDFYVKVASVIKNLVKKVGSQEEILAMSMVSASGNTVLLAKSEKPVIRAISWTDKRVTDETDSIFNNIEYTDLYDLTGWPYSGTFPLAHLSWLRTNKPEVMDSCAKICMTTDYINLKLTGKFKTNPSTATTFYLQDQKKGEWSSYIIEKLGITMDKLPDIVQSGSVLGHITEKASLETGLLKGTPVIVGSFDHPGAARGTGVLNEGEILLSCGTSWVGFYPIKDRKKILSMNMLIDPFLNKDGCWATMFALTSISENIEKMINRWISNKENKYIEFNELAAIASPMAGGLRINPMTDINRDFSKYKKENIARAIMEGTAFLMKDKIQYFKENGIKTDSAIMVGGPTASVIWPQILCDILGIGIDTIYGNNAGAAGAAVMAGIGIGIYKDEHDAIQKRSSSRIIRKPDESKYRNI